MSSAKYRDGYDPLGNLAALTDENGHVTQNGYDLLSQPVTKLLPDGSLTESRTYDAAGNLTALRHFNGKTTTYTYDPLNRLIARVPDPSLGEPTVTFTYTATGKRASMTDGTGTTTYTYDTLDRLATKATPEGTLTYSYDAAGNVASMASSNANGASASYSYDALNRLSSVVDNRLPSGTNTTTYTYDNANNLVTATYPNGIASTFQYDTLNRVASLSSPVASYNYQFSPTGNRTSATAQSGRTLKWSYDAINRLTGESVAQDPGGKDGSINYGLDPVGNRLTETSSFLPIYSDTFNFNADDWQETETYDSNGNVLNTGGKSFTYNSDNQLVSEVGAVGLQYDGDGNRVVEVSSVGTTRYLVDDLNPTGFTQVVEEISNGTVARRYTYGLERISENQTLNGAWTPSFYGYDGVGNVTQLTNIAGSITDNYDYLAFGTLFSSSGSTPNHYLYRGEQFDPLLGMYYLRARYYNPVTGRFLSQDPEDGVVTDPSTLHKYNYAGGNPVNASDPTGRNILPAASPALPISGTPPQTSSSRSSANEYASIVLNIAIQSIPAVVELACHVSIALTVDALKTAGETNIVPDLPNCTARGRNNSNCSAQDVETCQTLYPICKGNQCGDCLKYCLSQCEWPFHRPACNNWKPQKRWRDYPRQTAGYTDMPKTKTLQQVIKMCQLDGADHTREILTRQLLSSSGVSKREQKLILDGLLYIEIHEGRAREALEILRQRRALGYRKMEQRMDAVLETCTLLQNVGRLFEARTELTDALRDRRSLAWSGLLSAISLYIELDDKCQDKMCATLLEASNAVIDRFGIPLLSGNLPEEVRQTIRDAATMYRADSTAYSALLIRTFAARTPEKARDLANDLREFVSTSTIKFFKNQALQLIEGLNAQHGG